MTRHEWQKFYYKQIKLGLCNCILCNKQISKLKELSLEHLQPLSRKGNNDSTNWFPSHKSCNQEKGALTFEEYKQWKYLNLLRNGVIKGVER